MLGLGFEFDPEVEEPDVNILAAAEVVEAIEVGGCVFLRTW